MAVRQLQYSDMITEYNLVKELTEYLKNAP